MSPTSRQSIHSCLSQLHSWKPFNNYSTPNPNPNPNPNHNSPTTANTCTAIHPKRPCLSDRATSFFSLSIHSIDFSKLSLFDDAADKSYMREKFRRMAKKRRRRGGSGSVSGRSSDRNGVTATATCSDFMVAPGGTDSSGELFVNANWWASDVSEARRDRDRGSRSGEKDCFGVDAQGNESGYGSEPGYRGDAEFGYGDELDDEEEDARLFLWGDGFQGTSMEMVGEKSFSEQKAHNRGRRKKHVWRMMASVR